MKYVAVYRDQKDTAFSCPVTKQNGRWMLATANGPREITFYIYGNDVAGGFATFHDFRLEDVPAGLRGCDYISLRTAMYDTLPWPQKPAVEPIPQAEPEDFRLHVEPGGDSFRVLQEAGARATAAYRGNRERERQERQDTQPDPRRVAATMRINAEYARVRKPRGRGVSIVGGNGEQ